LAAAGFGLEGFTITPFSLNMLNTPTVVPNGYPSCPRTPSTAVCAGNQTYFGQRPSYYAFNGIYLTYDLSRWGVPDGQFQVAGNIIASSDQSYQARGFQFTALAWYQTFLDKKIELRIGYYAQDVDLVGIFVGGNFANTFGVSASIPAEMGLAQSPTQTPMAKTIFHLTDTVYNTFAVSRSAPATGPTGNPIVDEAHFNPTGLRFTIPGAGVLLVDEFGYQNAAAPGVPEMWLRFGDMYNTANFTNFAQLSNPNATIKGNSAIYFLADRQLWQQAPNSANTAYRGIYAGFSAMYSPPAEVAFSQYYEGRAYWYGPFDSRPTDMLSLVYTHNVFSHYLADQINTANIPLAAQGSDVALAHHAANSVTVSYLAHLMPGIYLGLGAGYTDNPSIEYFKGQGHSLNFISSLTTVW
jgi:porin